MMFCNDKRHVAAIVLAGGSGTRMQADITKQRMIIGGISILKRSLLAFEECSDIDEIVVIVRSDELEFAKEELKEISKLNAIGLGGATRYESAERGFELVSDKAEYVAIHDAARPLVKPYMISEVVAAAKEKGAATAAARVVDTIKVIDEDGNIEYTPKRSRLIRATTPQVFKKEIYERAIKHTSDKSDITDDNMLAEKIGVEVYAVIQDEENPKVTTYSDIAYVEMLLKTEDGNE